MLNYTLGANAAFSSGCGLAMIFGRDLLVSHFPGPLWLWPLSGAGLLLFALLLILMLRIPAWQSGLTPAIVIADLGWVLSTLALWLLYQPAISPLGGALIIGTNIIVGSLAALQFSAWRVRQRPASAVQSSIATNR